LNPTTAKYSWFSPFARSRERNIGWRIDIMLVTKQHLKKVKAADILCEYEGSDHCPCVLNLTH
jgi:exodeoxyribonuclease-3